jgi:hypothetical protein
MPFLINPFKNHDVSEFEGVYKPLRDSERHHSMTSAKDDKSSTASRKGPHGKDLEGSSPPPAYSANTIEGLRAEIDADVTAFGHDSVYDRT